MLIIPVKDENPGTRFPLLTLSLVVANVAVFCLMVRGGESVAAGYVERYALHPQVIRNWLHSGLIPAWPSLIGILTHMFLHGGIWHLMGNMLFLWIFGNNVEDVLGRMPFLAFYSISGVAAAFCHVFLEPNATMPMLGASGAIAGVLGGYMVLYPRAKVVTLLVIPFPFFLIWGLLRFIRVPALLYLGAWFAMQALLSTQMISEQMASGPRVAYFAHIGGFAAGLSMALIAGAGVIVRRTRRGR